MKEIKIIQRFFSKSNQPGDDCYFRDNYLYTTDTMAEGTHFRLEWSSPADLAHKLIHVNISDIGSSGGNPLFCFLNLGLSQKTSEEHWIEEFSEEFKKILKYYQIELAGGDTYFSEKTNLSMTVVGECSKLIPRGGGSSGEFIYITGSLGLSSLGLKALQSPDFAKKIPSELLSKAMKKHLRPTSRLKEFANIFQKYPITAAIDITDGLVQDAEKLSRASKIGLNINVGHIPEIKNLFPYLSMEEILVSGEELEVLFLSPVEITHNLARKIGFTTKEKKISYLFDGRVISIKEIGYEHFV